MKNAQPKEVQEMRESLSDVAKVARRAVRGVKDSQRNLRLSLVPKPVQAEEEQGSPCPRVQE